MRSLSLKLTLAFLAVAFTVAGLGAFFTRSVLNREFDRFVLEQAQENFTADVTAYYETYGSWRGVRQQFPRPAPPPNPPPTNENLQPPQPQRRQSAPGSPPPFILIDQNSVVVVAGGRVYRVGERLPAQVIAEGTPLEIDGEVVATVLYAGQPPALTADEQRYLERINLALLYAALAAGVIAVVLGIILARSLTRPILELTSASRTLAQGEFGQQVPVRSHDEIGQLAEAFNQMSTDLEDATRMRRQMTADIAHDLRTPLTVLSGYLESMREGWIEPTPARFDLLFNEVQRLNRLVTDLRTLSLADAGELSLHMQPVMPIELLDRVAEIYHHLAELQDIEIVVEATSAPAIQTDPERMVQVLGNLVSNALRFTPDGGIIKLWAKSDGEATLLAVQDNGAGISAEALPHIFDRFYRSDSSRSVEEGESGLGLAIVKSIVEAHGGSISVESERGVGTTFVISIPGAST